MNKAEAVVALQRAVALRPNNLTYCKELDHAQKLFADETASYGATRIFDAAIKIAIVGSKTVAVTWKLAMFRLRIFRAPPSGRDMINKRRRSGGLKPAVLRPPSHDSVG